MTAGEVKISSRNLNIHGTQDQSTAARLSKIFYQTWPAKKYFTVEIFLDFTMWALIVVSSGKIFWPAPCQKNIYNWCWLGQSGLSCLSILLLLRLIKWQCREVFVIFYQAGWLARPRPEEYLLFPGSVSSLQKTNGRVSTRTSITLHT